MYRTEFLVCYLLCIKKGVLENISEFAYICIKTSGRTQKKPLKIFSSLCVGGGELWE